MKSNNYAPRVSQEKAQVILRGLKLLVDEKKYRNPKLSAKQFADELNIDHRLISVVVKREHGMTFPAYVNHYRVRELCKLLRNDNSECSVSVELMALKAGFASRQSMSLAFAKELGTSPSEYRKRFSKKE